MTMDQQVTEAVEEAVESAVTKWLNENPDLMSAAIARAVAAWMLEAAND